MIIFNPRPCKTILKHFHIFPKMRSRLYGERWVHIKLLMVSCDRGEQKIYIFIKLSSQLIHPSLSHCLSVSLSQSISLSLSLSLSLSVFLSLFLSLCISLYKYHSLSLSLSLSLSPSLSHFIFVECIYISLVAKQH